MYYIIIVYPGTRRIRILNTVVYLADLRGVSMYYVPGLRQPGQPVRMHPGALSALTACLHSSSLGAHRRASSSNLARAMKTNSPGPTAGRQPRPNVMVIGRWCPDAVDESSSWSA